jgi:putative SOS response-associated peptidase YedK
LENGLLKGKIDGGVFMCGRYIPSSEFENNEIINILIGLKADLSRTSKENLFTDGKDVYPTHITPVIYSENGIIQIERIKWGFEKWDGKGVIINAKSETAETGRFFKPYSKNNRCLIPAHGYYEWQTMPDKKKVKYEFGNCSPSGIFMAGLYRQSKTENEFVILTKNVNPSISFIHDRMPLIIKLNNIQDWLSGSQNMIEYSKEIFNINFKEVV